MLVFGIDIPLVELIIGMSFIMFILLVEVLVLVVLLMKHYHKTKKVVELVHKLSDTILEIKKAEIVELGKLKGK